MNKKNPEQISSGSFNYLLNLGRVTSERSPEVSPLISACDINKAKYFI
jgi:hypothetical protein